MADIDAKKIEELRGLLAKATPGRVIRVECGAIGPADDTAELTIAAWNRRAGEPTNVEP